MQWNQQENAVAVAEAVLGGTYDNYGPRRGAPAVADTSSGGGSTVAAVATTTTTETVTSGTTTTTTTTTTTARAEEGVPPA
jgi:hypothetical protein